jgi:hypothetical protein
VPGPLPSKRLARAVQELTTIEDPLLRLDALRLARESIERLEADAVTHSRELGKTWTAIGALYGLTKQGAQQRFQPAHKRLDARKKSPSKLP